MRNVTSLCTLATTAFVFSISGSGYAERQPLVVSKLILVASHEVDRHLVEDTYRAELTHTGGPGSRDFAAVTARLVHPVSLPHPGHLEILDGNLEFGSVRAGQTVESRDTFAIRRRRQSPLKLTQLRWDISGRHDLIISDAWAGLWQLTISWRDLETHRVVALDRITTTIGGREPAGFSLLPDLVRCTWTGTDQLIEGECRARLQIAQCPAGGLIHLTVGRTGAALNGHGAWRAIASGQCPSSSALRGESIEIAGTRLAEQVEPQPFSPGLLRKLATHPGLIRLMSAAPPDRPPLACGDFVLWTPPNTCIPITPCSLSVQQRPGPTGFRFAPESDSDWEWLTNNHYLVTERGIERAWDLRGICSGESTGTANAIYDYANGDDHGTGRATISVSPPLVAVASATPAVINPGGSARLGVQVSGGIPPYRYRWSPTDSLVSAPGENLPEFLPSPLAAPMVTTTYRVMVTDSAGQFLGALPGQDPSHETEAPVEVTVTVSAATPGPAAAFTSFVSCCPPLLRLDASGSTGDIVSYTWELSWTEASPDAVTTSPVATFPINEGDRGTIELTVRAADGRTTTVSRPYPR